MLADESTNARPAIQIQKVKKVHFKYPFGIRSNEDVLAVNGLDLTINEVFYLFLFIHFLDFAFFFPV